jgi:MYXO-CTERM domain-containing protein
MPRRSRLPLPLPLALALALWAGPALAGELKFSHRPLEVDDQGKLTPAASDATSSRVESLADDEETWSLSIWAKLDNPAPGPLYVELHRRHAGQRLLAYSHEEAHFDGSKTTLVSIELTRTMGFRFDDELEVDVVQIADDDKKKILAKGKLTLVKGPKASSSPPPASGGSGGERGGEDEGEEESDQAAQDEADSFAGPEAPDGGDGDGPPAIEPGDKKGCRVDGDSSAWALAWIGALGVCAGAGRRRRRRAQ